MAAALWAESAANREDPSAAAALAAAGLGTCVGPGMLLLAVGKVAVHGVLRNDKGAAAREAAQKAAPSAASSAAHGSSAPLV